MTIIETQRLLISKITLQDAPFFLELVNTPNWIKYIGDKKLKTVKAAENNLKKGILKSYTDHGFGFYKLQLKEEKNKSIGICGLIKRKELDYVDIGFALLPEYERKGFGYESSIEILHFAKSKLKLDRILAITLPVNKSSINLLEKLGLTFQKKVVPFEDNEELLLFAKSFKS